MLWIPIAGAVGALAAPPLVKRPEPPVPVEDECTEALGLDVGNPVHPELVTDGVVRCAAVALPVSQYLDLHLAEEWGVACGHQYGLVVAGLEMDLSTRELERDEWRELALQRGKDLQRAQRWWRRPAVNLAVGAGAVLLGGGITLGLVVAL
jgi:hypothetical protein